MSPALFSQIVTVLGILGCIAAAVQEAYGATSHWGMIAGIVVTTLGKVSGMLAMAHANKLDVIAAQAPDVPATPPTPPK